METTTKRDTKFVKCSRIETRSNAGDGLWAAFLLPTCILVAALKHPLNITSNYKFWALFTFGLLVTTVNLVISLSKRKTPSKFSILTVSTSLGVTFLFIICLHTGYLFSLYSGVLCTIVYVSIYSQLFKSFPKCFTVGEAAIVTQGILLFLYTLTRNVGHAALAQVKTPMQTASLIIQLSLFGVCLTYIAVHKLNVKTTKTFYCVVIVMLMSLVFLPLHGLLSQSPILWIINFVISDIRKIKMMLYWVVCSLLGALAVSRQVKHARKATTSVRKIFHILLIAVCLPGLIMECTLLYLATGIVLGIFIALELLRAQEIAPIGRYLQDGYVVFRDEKDSLIALTPIYLLIGCAMPLWIHPSPCDVTDSTTFSLLPLLSGLLSVGVGDTAASIFGSCYGVHKWSNTKKSIEGTSAYILSQVCMIGVMIQLGYIDQRQIGNLIRLTFGVLITSLIEAKTTQIDNITLPFIMFLILV